MTIMQRVDRKRQDEVAREAARLIELGKAGSIREAIDIAADVLGYHSAPLPGVLRVRQHAQAMAMQSLGDAGYDELRRATWGIAEEVMTALEHALPDTETLLVGRAAAGLIDAGVTLHIRVYTEQSVTELARALVGFGYEEPTFDTVNTAYGPMNRIKFADDGQEVILTRCPPRLHISRTVDMFTGKAMTALTLEALRSVLCKTSA